MTRTGQKLLLKRLGEALIRYGYKAKFEMLAADGFPPGSDGWYAHQDKKPLTLLEAYKRGSGIYE